MVARAPTSATRGPASAVPMGAATMSRELRAAALDAALLRLEAGRYGVCDRCGQPIGAERLAARPGRGHLHQVRGGSVTPG
jgi:hypothetical protein